MSESTLLPCSAFALERALDITVATGLSSIPHYVRSTDNPATIPDALLPWLAWARRVEVWNSNWSDEQKRAAIASSFEDHRKKGTLKAVKNALAMLGIPMTIVEWFNDTPQRAPYTFRLVAAPGSAPLPPAFWKTLLGVVERTKNVRSHLGAVDIRQECTGTSCSAARALFGVRYDIPARLHRPSVQTVSGAAVLFAMRTQFIGKNDFGWDIM